MTGHAATAAAESRGGCHELVAEVIAGPETAARLGVPVGTVIEARHAVTPLDGSPSVGRIVSPAEAAAIRERITRGEED